MRTRSTALLTLSLTGVLLLTSGCLGLGHAPAEPASRASNAAPSPTTTPARTDLVEALQRSQTTAYRYTVQGDLPDSATVKGGTVKGSGAFDPGARVLESTTEVTGTQNPTALERIVIGTDSYSRAPGDKTWVHLDLTRVKPGSLAYFDMADPTGLVKFTSTISKVQRTGPHAYAGSFSAMQGISAFLPIGAPSIVSIGGGQSHFKATTDDQGWVTSITVELAPTNAPKLTMTTMMSGHGTPLPIKAPPKASIAEADDVYYRS